MTTDIIPADEAGSILTIDLAAIVANWRLLAARVEPAECAAVIKADAYGLGIAPVGAALAAAGCKTFYVAHVEEGRRLRSVAPKARIFVLNGFNRTAAGTYMAERLEAVIGSAEEFAALLDLAQHGARIPYALHVDTGMNRLGFGAEEALSAISAGMFDMLSPRMLMSHYVSSEEAENPINAAQQQTFETVRDAWIGRYEADRRKHDTFVFSLSNSSGIFLNQNQFYDLVRPGYALYGGNPCPDLANPMQPVVKLESRILQIRTIPAGASVGYNAQWCADRESRIATISLGYADGIFRSLSNGTGRTGGGVALVNGVACPFAGRVSMDLITLDVTEAPAAPGEMAVLLGDGVGVDDMAERAGTNGYNILTNLGSRFHRVYRGG